MNPIELIKYQLNTDESSDSYSVCELPEDCPFANHRLFVVTGRTKQFDFPTLPIGSMGYYVANGYQAIRLTRKDKEIEAILSEEWEHLSEADPVRLASLILKFYDGGIRATHHVLENLDALLNFSGSEKHFRGYELNEKQLSIVAPEFGSTELIKEKDFLRVQAVTLCGWMHDKRNLGVERFTIDRDGHPTFEKRQVLARKVFRRVPRIRY